MNGHFLTLNQAAKEVEKSPSTIHKALKNGKLSYISKDETGYKIDPAELYRVFPKNSKENSKKENDRINTNTHSNSGNTQKEALEIKLLLQELEHEKEKNKLLSEQLRKTENREENLRLSNEKLTDTLSKQTLMLEDMRQKPSQKPVEKRKGFFGRLVG